MNSVILFILGLVLLVLALVRTCSYLRYQRKRRGRSSRIVHKKGIDTFTCILYAGAAVMLILAVITLWLSRNQTPDPTDPISTDPGTVQTTDPPEPSSSETTDPPEPSETDPTEPPRGWQENNGGLIYVKEDGTLATGWLELEGRRYYLNAEGILQTGWLELEGSTYYLRQDGSMATGQVTIDGTDHFFTSAGAPILVVNPWHSVPQGYEPDLVELGTSIAVEGSRVERSCYDALVEMIADCNRESTTVYVLSSYRTNDDQTRIFNRKVNAYLDQGYDRTKAEELAATVVAVPGTSEHQLGLAVDIIDTQLWALEEEQEDLEGQQWLMEHCWEYGFILRYPKDKIDITGIIYEPWHYRYVGREVAAELHQSGQTLEEYIQSLTQ